MSPSLRRSRAVANVDGSVRERQYCPSSLSKRNCWEDMPTKPASSASVSHRAIVSSSAPSGRTPARVARSSPIAAARMSECPMNAATFGPSGSSSSACAYSWALLQLLPRATASMTCLRGIASTRPNRSPAVSGPTCTVEIEHEPSSTVVMPCRSDSLSCGLPSTSTS